MTVQKAARRDVLREQPDIKFLIDKFTFTDEDIAALLVKHRTGAGNMPTHALSCDWLKANFNVWPTWVRHTAPDELVFFPSSSGVAAWVIAVPVVLGVVCLIIAVTGVFFGTRKPGVDNTHAPKTAAGGKAFVCRARSVGASTSPYHCPWASPVVNIFFSPPWNSTHNKRSEVVAVFLE